MTLNGPHNMDEWMRHVEADLRALIRRGTPSASVPTGVDPTPQIDASIIDDAPVSDTGDELVDSPIYERPEEPGSPRTPSQPLVNVRLGVVTLTWDGLAEGGVAMSSDVQLVRIHREQQRTESAAVEVTDEATPANADFTPTPVNYVGRILYPGPGSLVMPDQEYNTTWFYRLVAVDYDGNSSSPSTATAVVTTPLVDTDIIGQVLNGANFMDGTISTAALADGSVSGEKIAAASIDPSKLNFVIAPGSAGGNFSFYAPDPPLERPDATPLGEGDLWFDVDDNFRIHRWTAGVWADVKDVTIEDGAVTADAIAAGAVIAGKLAAGAVTAGTVAAEAITAGTIAANAVGANEIAANAIVAGKIAVNAITAANIQALAISSDKIAANAITAAKIAVGAVAAGKISTGELAAGVVIYAGPSNGTHAEMTNDGIAAYVADIIDGIPNLSVRFGSSLNGDVFSVVGAGGTFVTTISDEGVVSAAGLSVDNDPTVMGSPLVGKLGNTLPDIVDFANEPVSYDRDLETDPIGIIEQYGKGSVAWGQFSGAEFTNDVTAGEEMALFELGYDCEPGRQYSPVCNPILMNVVGNGPAVMRVRFTSDGSDPTLSSGILARDWQWCEEPFQSFCIPTRLFNGGATAQTQLRCLFTIGSETGGPQLTVYDSQSVLPWIADLGPVKTRTGTVRTLKTGVTPPAPTTAPKAWTKTYSSTSFGTYKGDGTKRSDTGGDVVQGYNSFNGDGEGVWIFPSMTSDLASVTVTKVEAYIYFNHWYYNSGGVALINTHNYSAAPASSPSQTRRYSTATPKWPKPGGRWVVLPSAVGAGLKAGTIKGIGIGPAGSTNLLYYGRANSVAKIRVSGTK